MMNNMFSVIIIVSTMILIINMFLVIIKLKHLTAGFGVAHVAEDLLADENCFKK